MHHIVAERMTEIMLRHCPGCKTTLVKVGGCNQMECPHCKTCSCYVCRKKIGLVLCLRCPTYSSAEEDDIRNRYQLLEERKKEAAHRHDKDLIASLSKLGFKKEKGRTVQPSIHPLVLLQDYDDVTIFMAVIFLSLFINDHLLSLEKCDHVHVFQKIQCLLNGTPRIYFQRARASAETRYILCFSGFRLLPPVPS